MIFRSLSRVYCNYSHVNPVTVCFRKYCLLTNIQSQSKSEDKIVSKENVNQSITKLDNFSQETIGEICRELAYGEIKLDQSTFAFFLDKLIESKFVLNDKDLGYLAFTLAKHRLYHPVFLDLAIKEITENYDKFSLHTLSKILKTISFFDHFKKDDFKGVVDNIESNIKLEELMSSPKSASIILQSLIIQEIYPETLINQFLSPDFIKSYPDDEQESLKPLNSVKDALTIECYSKYKNQIEMANNLLKEKKPFRVLTMQDMLSKIPTDLTSAQRFQLLCYLGCREFYPKQACARNVFSFCLTPEIIICNFRNHPISRGQEIQLVPGLDQKATVFIPMFLSYYADNPNTQVTGHHRLRNRLLEKIGFKIFKIKLPHPLTKRSLFGILRKKLPMYVDG